MVLQIEAFLCLVKLRIYAVTLGSGLNTERLVPLDAQARGIVAQLAARTDASGAWLFTGQEGGPAKTTAFRDALRQVAEDLVLAEPATTHRLRHTYATELLNAGVSLVGVMKLLGHTDYRMTLRYAALLPETVREQYDAAIAKVEASYEAATAPGKVVNELPTRLLADVISVLKRDAADGHGAESKRLAALAKRLDAINTEVRAIEARKTTHKPRSREEK